MKQLLLFISFMTITSVLFAQETYSFAQEAQKTLDKIYLTSGETIETRIVRVNKRKIYYYDPTTYAIIEISRKQVQNYEFNDDFFQTNPLGKLDHREVVNVDGYKKDEIYRAIKDWFQVNSRRYGSGVFMEDTTHKIILGNVNTAEYMKLDFITVMTAVSDQDNLQTYALFYDVNVRIKDNRFKVYIMDFEISSNNSIYDKPILRSYEKRKTKDGIITVHGTELVSLKEMIKEQIAEIKNHCELVRLNDTYHNQIVKQALKDDDW